MKNRNRGANALASLALLASATVFSTSTFTPSTFAQGVPQTVVNSATGTAIAAAKEALELGAKMADGSIYAGLTADGKAQIFAMPTDLELMMTFNDAVKAVQKLNTQKALGHDDWQIPRVENLRVLYENQDKGALKGTFDDAAVRGSGYSGRYWSSTEDRDDSSWVYVVGFWGGSENWYLKDYVRFACRPVRLVEVPVPRPGLK